MGFIVFLSGLFKKSGVVFGWVQVHQHWW